MNITIDIRCLMTKNYSGVAEYTYNLLDNIFKLNHKNQYNLFYNSSSNVTEFIPQFHYSNVKFHGFKYPNKFFNLSLKYLRYPKIDKLIPETELFFIPNINFLALTKNVQKIITVHDLSFEIFPEFFSKKRNFWHQFIKPQKLINSCDKIIADSQSTKNDLINIYKISEEKIKVIHLGVDTNFYKPIEHGDLGLKRIKDKYILPDNFILYLGTLEPRKNIESLIQAFNKLKSNAKFNNLHLIIAGDNGWNYNRIYKTADQSPFKDQIKFLGYISKKEKPYLYNLANIFVFPSYYEGFGLPILEAQACGTPVITGLNSSLPEITNNSALLIKPDNVTELTQAIKKLLLGPKLKQEIVNSGLENVKRFSWQKTAEKTLEYIVHL